MKWFEFSQNNSGGYFVVDEVLCHRLLIEAASAEKAVEKAEELGCYWNGVAEDRDCRCCGDRWLEPWGGDGDGMEFPHKYTEGVVFNTVRDYAVYMADEYGWTKPDARLFYADGRIEEVYASKGRLARES